MPKEHVVLVDENNIVIGTADKSTVHHADTPLHRGFSVFLFNSDGKLLLQQRAKHKVTWPGVWSNSCCGHPMLDEKSEVAARRRMKYEIGVDEADIHMILPDYRYKAEREGVVENEFCPVMIAFSDVAPKVNPDEVDEVSWIEWEDFKKEIAQNPGFYSPWCEEEVTLLDNSDTFHGLRNPVSV